MAFFDMHCHMLYGVDDGAASPEMMFQMLEAAYADGTRAICLTPHFSPYLFGDTAEKVGVVFEELKAYAAKKHPDMKLYLGNELGYYGGCERALNEGLCRHLGDSRFILVDFPADVSFFELRSDLEKLMRMGYRIVLAHPERYPCMAHKLSWIREFIDDGGLVQVDISAVTGSDGPTAKSIWKKLIQKHLVHVVSTDGHNLTTRPPILSSCLPYLQKYCSPEEISALTFENADRILNDRSILRFD